ncbi:MAG: tRNA (adenosine(37)-N6)-threonylcarbamoyltransferase complex dimerization subunit type 1 TsaB [Acidobacteriota bacterium]|nr:tRNA (adenosine(37)-N6)-threonylcarbamoyltransferase complex dimerization subunit type 1 TsaB [Acidobacteriota bacterium]
MILAFDVTDKVASVSWLKESDGSRGEETTAGRKATEVLVPMMSELRGRLGEPLTAAAVVTGPGSFTGIRVGLATALGLKASLGIPVYGFNKGELIAARFGTEPSVLLLPAGRQQLMVMPLANGKLAGAPIVIDKNEAPADTRRWVLSAMEDVDAEVIPASLTGLMLDRIQAGGLTEADHPLEPMYIRPPDARQGQTLIDKLLAKPP